MQGVPLQLADEVEHNDQVQQQHADPKHRHLFKDLVEFERKQQARRYHRQIRGPRKLQPQPNALHQQHPRIAETDERRQQHTMGLQRIDFQNQAMNEARVGIQMKGFDQKRKQSGNLSMHQLEEAQPKKE